MFDNKRYVTRGISEKIPEEIQFFMWEQIDSMKVTSKDYLQIFKLDSHKDENNVLFQNICHTQEQPPYYNSFMLSQKQPLIHAKIYVIDDSTHSTMLLSDEY